MKVSVEKPGSPAQVLVHFGKKGMKWGVRQAYAQRQGSIAARERRVGKGGGSKIEKFRVHGTTSGVGLRKAGGSFKKAASNRSVRTAAHAKRISTGKATTMDVLRFYGTLRTSDIIAGQRKRK